MITNLELSEPVQILNMKHTCTPSKGNDFFMRLFYRQRWERTKFKLIVSAQDYEILNWTKLNFSFHCFIFYRCERNVIIFVIHWRNIRFSLTEHVVTFISWQMALVVKQPVHVHTFTYNRLYGIFWTDLFNWCSHYLVSCYLNIPFYFAEDIMIIPPKRCHQKSHLCWQQFIPSEDDIYTWRREGIFHRIL